MNFIKITITLLILLFTCEAFSQTNKQQQATCDSVVNNQALQIINFKNVITQYNIEQQQFYEDKLELNLEIHQSQLKLKRNLKKLPIWISLSATLGIILGYTIK